MYMYVYLNNTNDTHMYIVICVCVCDLYYSNIKLYRSCIWFFLPDILFVRFIHVFASCNS